MSVNRFPILVYIFVELANQSFEVDIPEFSELMKEIWKFCPRCGAARAALLPIAPTATVIDDVQAGTVYT